MVIYQLYIDKFNKNIQGLIDKLDYLADLGMDAIWVLPHYPSPMVDGGYDVSDYVNIRQDLGTIDDFKNLTKIAHEKNIKIFIDLILNHTSTEHEWFKTARSSKNNDKRDYYIWSNTGTNMLSSINAFPNIKLTNWVFNPFSKDYYFATFYPLQPDLNWDNPEVLNEFLKIIDFWADLGADGFRLDAVTHIIKRNYTLSIALPETHLIVTKIRKHIDSRYPGTLLIGEADLHTYKAKDYFGNGDECHMLFNFEESVKLLTNICLPEKEIVKSDQNHNSTTDSTTIPTNTEWIYFIGTHDTISTHLLDPVTEEKFITKVDPEHKYQNAHDKRLALRIGEIFKDDPEKIAVAFNKLMSTKGSQVVYYGDEIGMRNNMTDEFLIDNRFEVRGNFDWTEADKQQSASESILNKVKDIIRISKHQEPKS